MTNTAKEELEVLTSADGPLVQLVGQVRASNALARRAMRLLYLIAAALLVLTCILVFIVSSMARTSRDMVDLTASAESVLHKVALLSEQATVQATATKAVQEQLNDAPKIVADETTGKLKIVAVVDAPAPPKNVVEAFTKSRKSGGSKNSSLADALTAVDNSGALDAPVAAAEAERTVVEFALDPSSATVKEQTAP